MDKTEIENNLDGIKLIERQEHLFVYALNSPPIIYQFKIEPQKGLTEYWIVSMYLDMINLVDDYTYFFGEYKFKDTKYWWFDTYLLPKDIVSICIFNYDRMVNVIYFYKNSFE